MPDLDPKLAQALLDDGIKSLDLLLAAHRIGGGNTTTICAVLLRTLDLIAEHMPPAQRRELSDTTLALVDEWNDQTPMWQPEPRGTNAL